ncbi:MAG: hypothetical protein H7Y11_00500 [Armatimonadetes bacterium]|nr:hypothetical protein [Anaerolineae bacterium]
MAYKISWLVPNRVMYQQYHGAVTLEDIITIQAMVDEYMEIGIAPVHVLIEVLELTDYPKRLAELQSVIKPKINEKQGWIVIVTTNTLIRFLASVGTQLSLIKVNMTTVDTRDAALKFLQEHDPLLVIPEELRDAF